MGLPQLTTCLVVELLCDFYCVVSMCVYVSSLVVCVFVSMCFQSCLVVVFMCACVSCLVYVFLSRGCPKRLERSLLIGRYSLVVRTPPS